MKFLYILVTTIILASCSNQSATEATDAQQVLSDSTGVTYNVDLATSGLTWTGSSLSGSHNGTLMLSEGSLIVKNNTIASGSFTVDMTSIKDLDLTDAEKNGYLVGHLNDTDFFNTKVFPTGKFEMTSVEALENDSLGNTHQISGNLTLKGISKNISFPAKVDMTETEVKATGSVVLDRLQWGITYSSLTAFPSLKAKLKDKAINDNFTVGINLTAKK